MSCLWFCFMMFRYAQFLTMFNVGCMGYEWYFQLCDFPAQEINMMCCEFLKWFSFQAHGFVTLDMKPLVRVSASRFDHFYSNKRNQNKKEKTFTLFLHSLESRTYRDITYGIRAKVQHLDLMDSSTYRYAVNNVIWIWDIKITYLNAHYKGILFNVRIIELN